MPEIPSEQLNFLVELFDAVGKVGEFFPIPESDEVLCLELLKARLVQLEEDGKGQVYVALSSEGYEIAQAASREQNSLHVQLRFDMRDSLQAKLVQQLSEIADDKTSALLGDLFNLHQALESGDIDSLMQAYPEFQATIQKMIRASVDSQMMAQEQHRFNHLVGEISELKSILSQQAQQAPKMSSVQADDEPIAPPAAAILRPVLPHSPQGQPKQLTVPQFALPKDDEEDSDNLFVVQKDADAGKRANENFLQSLQRLQK